MLQKVCEMQVLMNIGVEEEEKQTHIRTHTQKTSKGVGCFQMVNPFNSHPARRRDNGEKPALAPASLHAHWFPPTRARMLAWTICGRQRIAWHGSAYAGDFKVAVEDLPRPRYVRKSASGIAVAAGGLGREGSFLQETYYLHVAAQPPAPARDLGRRQPFIRGHLDRQRLCADARHGAVAVAAVAAAEPTTTITNQEARNLPRGCRYSPGN
ncbi:hypothetical protein GGI43DRAFT_396557 [Trichoderma evansii]